jgi:stress-induced-phosphoprotein 1
VLYSNRSACYASLKDFQKALDDANKCVEIAPTWSKGYGRKGAALHGQGDLGTSSLGALVPTYTLDATDFI